MTRRIVAALAVLAGIALTACNESRTTEIPPPAPYDAGAIAHFCGMALGEHQGPKGQVWVGGRDTPYWFTSVHDVIAFTLLPEEPKNIRAIYVSDMAKAADWAHAEGGGWIEARQAFFVIGSDIAADMGPSEEVPFSDKAAAEVFVAKHGGRVVAFNDIPKDNILGEPVRGPSSGTVN
jgi:copper chaperone NosL